MPTEETIPAAHSAAIVSARMRRGVTQRCPLFCSHVLKPEAPDAAAIAQPTHIRARIPPPAGRPQAPGLLPEVPSRRRLSSGPRPAATARAARASVSSSPFAVA